MLTFFESPLDKNNDVDDDEDEGEDENIDWVEVRFLAITSALPT